MQNSREAPAGMSWNQIERPELAKVLREHARFLERKPGGRRAMLAFHDLSNYDLSGQDLSEADLTGARLRRARLTWTTLRATNLFGAGRTSPTAT